ncbi:DUF1992 domain-containing protein [Nocardioides sp. TRM66260-LWL]|uniref:DnaJ family domain-containing protein n=1 Tax=Nocardioides sp. TRM66260-LWL TaxID=2874478 RepID=UPI001CC80545|nr:DUF1992 domain-containing protein [Nocardioides sp. TRM66260-LWL]MBZ5735727.1 DUF1992 domain-containing protein [Nocardioides sp. TRM66260-LWL]
MTQPPGARRTPEERDAARARIEQQHTWVDQQIRIAMARGDFDDLPGAGKPLPDLDGRDDPDWWLRRLVEREQITGVLPPALQLRKDDAELDDLLATYSAESEARREIEEFNARVIRARYTPVDGPPLITMPRDVEATLDAWRERRAEIRRRALADAPPPAPRRGWRRLFGRRV